MEIFEEGELDEKVVVSKMEITSPHGAIPGKTQSGEAMFYNLDAIISVVHWGKAPVRKNKQIIKSL